jgi:hypothetical protein
MSEIKKISITKGMTPNVSQRRPGAKKPSPPVPFKIAKDK